MALEQSRVSVVGRLGTALGRVWDGLEHAESPMFTGLGTLGRLRQGVGVGVVLASGPSLPNRRGLVPSHPFC